MQKLRLYKLTKPKSIGAIIQNFKSISTRKINRMTRVADMPVWQRNYYEHIIRNEAALQTIRAYIDHNPGVAETRYESI